MLLMLFLHVHALLPVYLTLLQALHLAGISRHKKIDYKVFLCCKKNYKRNILSGGEGGGQGFEWGVVEEWEET